MASSLIRSVREYPELDESERLELRLGYKPKVPGRIVTTIAKAKELRPFVEKLVTIARKALPHQEKAAEFATDAVRNSDEWKSWRNSPQWHDWAQAIAPAVALRRRAFSMLRDREAVDILFDELAERFADRPGGYTRVVRLAEVRLGDSGQKAIIEFVGERDRVKKRRESLAVAEDTDETAAGTEPSAEEASAETETAEAPTATAEEDSAAQETAEAAEAPEADAEDGKKEES